MGDYNMKYRALVTAEVIKPMLEQFEDRIEFVYDGYNINHEVMPHNELIEKKGIYYGLVTAQLQMQGEKPEMMA